MWSIGQDRLGSSGGQSNRLVFRGRGLEPHLGRHPHPPWFHNMTASAIFIQIFLKLADNQNCHNIVSSDGPMIDYSRKSVGLGFRLRQSIVK